jgi:hypothetical protein
MITMERLSSNEHRPIVRAGRTVRRPVGPWTPAVHALLRHLEEVGFDGAPRMLGIDEEGREVLTYVEGEESHHARRPELHSAAALVEVARLIRRYHEAVAGFVPPEGAVWQTQAEVPDATLVCHNDLAPVNTIFVADRPRAFIDWDYAAPATVQWELACAVWSFVPLYDDTFCRQYGYPTEPRGPRIRLLLDAYGLESREGFLDLVRARELALYDMVRRRAQAGEDGFVRVWQTTRGQRWLDAVAYLDQRRDEWERALA